MNGPRTRWIACLIGLLAASGALGSSRHGPAPKVEEVDVRSLPSLVVEWAWRGTVDEWRLDDGVVYMVGGGHLSALDAETGEELWAYELAQECSCSKLGVLPSRIAAGIDGRAILVDRASGALVADVPLGKSVTALVADPLVFGYRSALGMEGMVRLDEVSGVELARYQRPHGMGRVEALGGRLIVTLQPEEGADLLVGLDGALQELWRRPLPDDGLVTHEDGELFFQSWEEDKWSRFAIDPESGRLSAAPRPSGAERTLDLRVERLSGGLVQVIRTAQLPRLVRPGKRGGEPLWEVELPVVIHASVEWGGQAVLASQRWGGRGVVLMVDRADGTILQRLAGLRQMSDLRVHGNLLLSETASGIAAVRLDRFGPPEAAAMTVAETVRGILAGLRGDEPALEPYDVRSELEALGVAALPFLVEEIPTASDEVVEMIAALAAEHAYRPAAAPLAVRAAQALAEPGDPDEPWRRRSYLIQLARALAAVAGPSQVPVLEALIEPGNRLASARMPLLAALGRLAPERALAFVGRLRARYGADGEWLELPAAGPWIEIAALEPEITDLDEFARLRSSEEMRQVMLRRRSAISGPGPERWVVFPSPVLGLLDLWAAPIDSAGRAGKAVYLGPQPLPPSGAEEDEIGLLEARLTAAGLDVGFPGGQHLVVGLDELVADRDGDGLTDRLESHLGLDPASRDSDADGLADPVDRAPNGGRREPSREERAFLALHETQTLLADTDVEGEEPGEADPTDLWSGPDHRFLIDAPPLEWRAGGRATFRVPDLATPGCETAGYRLAAEPPRPLGPDELAVEQYLSCPPEFYQNPGFTFVLRETRGGWVVSGVGE